MMFFNKYAGEIAISLRVLLASVGGFVLANLSAIAIASVMTADKVDGITAGMMLSFIVYAIAILLAFSVKSIRRAALSILLPCVLLFVWLYAVEGAVSL